MESIIERIPTELILTELTPEKKIRDTNKAGNEIYVVTWQDSPNTMREIGRLREIAFRAYGGGSGKAVDLDDFDTMDKPYKNLIVWNPEAQEIIGGYRYMMGNETPLDEEGQPILATSHMFRFSEDFVKNYLPWTIELGRSFVTLEYQSTRMGTKSLFALDNLWDGLGAIVVMEPSVKYCFGKFTMYPSYNRTARDMILYFLRKHFRDEDRLVWPKTPLQVDFDEEQMKGIFAEEDFKKDYRILNREVHNCGVAIPPLVNAYMGLSPTMRFFETAINDEFGDVEESGILIALDEIWPEKRMRHVDSFAAEHPEYANAATAENRIFYKV
jgi:hypothetical protein